MSDVRTDFDLSSYSIEDLKALVEMVNKEIHRKQQMQIHDVRKQMEQLASSVGKSVEEILDLDRKKKGAKKTVGPAKFRNPDDPEQTWTGRGKRPNWLQKRLDEGANIEDFAI